MNDIIDLLLSQHRELEGHFAEYESGNHEVVATIEEKIKLHTKIEEEVVYPAMVEYLDNGEEEVEHAKEEHKEADQLLADLKANKENVEKFTTFKDAVTHHVAEEEGELFPEFREKAPEEARREMLEAAEGIVAG